MVEISPGKSEDENAEPGQDKEAKTKVFSRKEWMVNVWKAHKKVKEGKKKELSTGPKNQTTL